MKGATMKGAAMKLTAVALLAGLVVGPAFAGEPTEKTAKTDTSTATVETTTTGNQASGLVVFWDPETRTFTQPNAEQRAHIVEEMNRQFLARFAASKGVPLDREAVVVETLPNGAKRARLPLSFLNMSVVRVAPDGSFVPDCAQSPEKAGEVLRTPVSPANQPLEEK